VKYGAEWAVVVVSWNTRDLLERCLASLAGDFPAPEVVVVDNGSRDGSAEAVARRFPGVRLIANDHNRGFAAAVNQGLRSSSAEFVLLLGSDAEILGDAPLALLSFLRANPSYGAAAPRLVDEGGWTQRACMNFPRLSTALWFGTPLERWAPDSRELRRYFARDFDHAHDADVVQPPATALLLRRSALEQVGLLDERLVLYFNDVDLSRRLAQAGWKTRFLCDARVRHVGGASTRLLPERLERWHLDRLRYFVKHHGAAAGAWVKGCTALAWADFVLGRLLAPLRSGRDHPRGPESDVEAGVAAVTRAFLRFLSSKGLPRESESARLGPPAGRG
jgi:N-acetylglucosaminyl-diphospho-decaprenol L-rhamnosyltransferase